MRRVFGALHVGHRADEVHLDLLRQFLRDLVLRAPQDKGRQLGPQAAHQRAVAIVVQHGFERSPRSEEARQEEAEDAPEIELAVFERRARQDQPMARADREAGLRDLGVGILDELALVQHRVAEFDAVEQRAVFAQLRVAGQPQHRDPGPRGEVMPRLPGRPTARWGKNFAISSRHTGTTLAGQTIRLGAVGHGPRPPAMTAPGAFYRDPSRRPAGRGSRLHKDGAAIPPRAADTGGPTPSPPGAPREAAGRGGARLRSPGDRVTFSRASLNNEKIK